MGEPKIRVRFLYGSPPTIQSHGQNHTYQYNGRRESDPTTLRINEATDLTDNKLQNYNGIIVHADDKDFHLTVIENNPDRGPNICDWGSKKRW